MRSNTLLSMEQVLSIAPAVAQDSPHPDRSEIYVPISTQQVITAMSEAGYGVSRAQQTQSRNAEARSYARHLLTFRPMEAFDKPAVGGAVPEVVLINSHDGNCSYRLHVGLYRFVCENGLIMGDTFETIRIRHRGFEAQDVVQQSKVIFEHYVPRLREWVKGAESTVLTQKKQEDFAREAMLIRFEDGAFEPSKLLHIRRKADAGNDLWSVYNRVQENLMQGGIEYKDSADRNRQTRAIGRVTKDVIFNQRLWETANEYLPEAA